MNLKNTVMLLLTLIVLTGALYIVRTRSTEPAPAVKPATAFGGSTTRDLIEGEFGDFVKVSIRREGRPEWVFEKKAPESGGAEAWYMTAPDEFKVVSWEVEKFPRQIGKLQYEISYEPGQPGAVTAAEAGLEPPQAVVTMTDAAGKSVSVEIGGPASEREMYVRVAGTDRICVGKSSLTGLFKNKAVEYRDKQLWSFNAADAVRLEVVDRSGGAEKDYVFTRDGSRWMIESPFSARATEKVSDAINAMARLRAIQWQDDDAAKLPIYGLDTPALTMKVTVEEEVPVKKEAAEKDKEGEEGEADKADAEPTTETKTTVYELDVSDRSPIGEDTKTYIRSGDGPMVATIMKTVVDKLKPDMSEWRDMQVTPVDVTSATSVEIRTPGGTVTAVRDGAQWRSQADDSLLDSSAIKELLTTVAGLKAAAFTDANAEESSTFGFAEPQADLRFVVPGVEQSERLVIGTYTDSASKQLVYARRNEALQVAKVRTADVEKLIRPPVAYIDRTVTNLVADLVNGLTIESTNPLTQKRQTSVYGKDGAIWSMTSPVKAEARQDAMEKLVKALANLHAERVVGESDQRTAFGLHEPTVSVVIQYEPTAGKGDETAKTLDLQFSRHDGNAYVLREGANGIFQIGTDLLDQLDQELRQENVWKFDAAGITSFRVADASGDFTFNRKDGRWIFDAEPDLPLDTGKVEELLLRIRDLKIVRYVDQQGADMAAFGLDAPQATVTVTDDTGVVRTLLVATQSSIAGYPVGTVEGAPGIFAMEKNAAERFAVSLGDLESTP